MRVTAKYLLFVFNELTRPDGDYKMSEIDAIAAMDLTDEEIDKMW